MPLATLVGQEPHVSMARCVEFAMRLEKDIESLFINMKLRQSQGNITQIHYNDFYNYATRSTIIGQKGTF